LRVQWSSACTDACVLKSPPGRQVFVVLSGLKQDGAKRRHAFQTRGKPSNHRYPLRFVPWRFDRAGARIGLGPTMEAEKWQTSRLLWCRRRAVRGWMTRMGMWRTAGIGAIAASAARRPRFCLGETVQIDGREALLVRGPGSAGTLLRSWMTRTRRLIDSCGFRHLGTAVDYFRTRPAPMGGASKPVAFTVASTASAGVNRKEVGGEGGTQVGSRGCGAEPRIICCQQQQAKEEASNARWYIGRTGWSRAAAGGIVDGRANTWLPGFITALQHALRP